jgi:2-polyprenyl-3-methyl-5-hydroxy-6-metoxy-1,4-benzoquinol methylase
LDYFTEWGGRNWKYLLRFAIDELQLNDSLKGADFLDIGTRYGKMAVLFSLMGARVTGIDIMEPYLSVAREEAKKWNLSNEAVNFMAYNGDLDIFPDESFDIVLTKSVLVLLPNLENFLRKISMKLRSNGRVVFLENGRGNYFIHAMRTIRHRKWDYRYVNYFTDKEVKLIQSIFQIDTIRRTIFPPVYLFLGQKRL